MSIGYTWEQLYGAVLALTHSDGALQHRLARASRALDKLTPEDFPDEERRAAYTTLVQALRPRAPQSVHGTVAPSPAALSPDQAHALAEQLLRLYTDVTRLEEQHYRSFSARDL
jgi:hypothetical protein